MKVMSFNLCCWGSEELSVENRAPRVAATIRKYSPDLFGVQEATPFWMAYLKENLPEYASVGAGREEKGKGESSAIFYKKSVFDLKSAETFWLSETPDVVSLGWDADCKRVCTRANLINLEDGKEYCYYNTHLDHVGPNAQLNGIKLINESMKKYAEYPMILTGDFNVFPDSEVYAEVFLKDTRIASGFTGKCSTYHGYGHYTDEEDVIIDYCFVSENLTVKSYQVATDKVDGKYVSDHYPVIAEIE